MTQRWSTGVDLAVRCGVCSEVYETKVREPLVLPCGHTFCRVCLSSVEAARSLCCPSCRSTHPTLLTQHLPVNYAVLDLSQQTTDLQVEQHGVCSIHGEQLCYWCRQCAVLVCGSCLLHQHLQQGHRVLHAVDFILERKQAIQTRVQHLQAALKVSSSRTVACLHRCVVNLVWLCQESKNLFDLDAELFEVSSEAKNLTDVDAVLLSETRLRSLCPGWISQCRPLGDELGDAGDDAEGADEGAEAVDNSGEAGKGDTQPVFKGSQDDASETIGGGTASAGSVSGGTVSKSNVSDGGGVGSDDVRRRTVDGGTVSEGSVGDTVSGSGSGVSAGNVEGGTLSGGGCDNVCEAGTVSGGGGTAREGSVNGDIVSGDDVGGGTMRGDGAGGASDGTVNKTGIRSDTVSKVGSDTESKTVSGTMSKADSGTMSKVGRGTASKAGSGTARKAGSGTASKAGSGTASKAGSDTESKADSGTASKADSCTVSKVGSGTASKAGSGTPSKVGSGTTSKAGSGSASKAGSGTASKAASGTASKADSGTASKAVSGTASKTGSDTASKADSGTASKAGSGTVRGHVQSNTIGSDSVAAGGTAKDDITGNRQTTSSVSTHTSVNAAVAAAAAGEVATSSAPGAVGSSAAGLLLLWPLICRAVSADGRQADIRREDNYLLVSPLSHCLTQSHLSVQLSMLESFVEAASPLVYLEVSASQHYLGRLVIRLWPRLRRAQHFKALCLATLGPSFLGSKFEYVGNRGRPGEYIVGGSYLVPDPFGTSKGAWLETRCTRGLMDDLEWGGDFVGEEREGLLQGAGGGHPEYDSLFCICSRSEPAGKSQCPFGEVVTGMEVVREAVLHDPVSDLTITGCGLLVPDV